MYSKVTSTKINYRRLHTVSISKKTSSSLLKTEISERDFKHVSQVNKVFKNNVPPITIKVKEENDCEFSRGNKASC